MIITISGKAKHGKDLTATVLKEKLESLGKRVLVVHFADYLKMVCEKYYGWNGNKDEAGRTLLQYVGTDVIRKRNPCFWVDTACNLIKVLEPDFDYFLVPDCRFKEENEIPVEFYGFDLISLNVIRTENGQFYDNDLTEEQKNHSSETSLDEYNFDYVISSEAGRNNLEKEVDKFIVWLKDTFKESL